MAERLPSKQAVGGSTPLTRFMDLPPTKLCPRRREVKPADAFAMRRGRYLQSYCQACLRLYQRGRPRTLLVKRLVRAAKSNQRCIDCGVAYPHYVLDFDHRPGCEKRANDRVNVLGSGERRPYRKGRLLQRLR